MHPLFGQQAMPCLCGCVLAQVGAHPGPVCYRKGGHLAVTDANLALGRIVPAEFPRIFGPSEDQPLDAGATAAAFEALAAEVNAAGAAAGVAAKSVDEVAFGFIQVPRSARQPLLTSRERPVPAAEELLRCAQVTTAHRRVVAGLTATGVAICVPHMRESSRFVGWPHGGPHTSPSERICSR